ncbi:MAG: four helix bundle protein [Chitinivibrionales bacterium]|nr:four helix bundle protein [Chitinivibrionales bacterium]
MNRTTDKQCSPQKNHQNQSFKQLNVWKEAKNLAVAIYKITGADKFSRDFGLKDQIQRSSVSVVSNIAEGYERTSNKEFLHFLNISQGSLSELRTQLEIAHEIGYINENDFILIDDHCCKVGAMLTNLKKARKT